MDKETTLPPALKMRLASMNDLVRMAFFSAARNVGLNFLLYQDEKSEKWFIGFLTGVVGYYSLRGLPMHFFVELDEKPKKVHFIKYNSLEVEKWEFCDSTPTTTKWNYLPVIELAEKPSFL